jgi:hypothetical protein
MARWFIGFLPLVLVAGCGDDSNNEDPLATASGFCDEWAQRACNKDVVNSCSQEPSKDACLESQSSFCRTKVKASKYNKAGARECLDAVEKAYADGQLTSDEFQIVRDLGIPCDQVIGASGVFCKTVEDCDEPDAMVCQPREGSKMGVCVIDGGFSCKETDLSCAQGFYCNGSLCAALSKSECASDEQCKPEYKCNIAEDAEIGTCKLRLDVDEACTDNEECQTHVCWGGKCVKRIVIADVDKICEDLR